MELKCQCGTSVGEGEIKFIDKKGRRRKKLFIKDKLKGQVLTNNSSDPEKWSYLCSRCQREGKNDKKKM